MRNNTSAISPSDVAFYDRVTGADVLDHCSRLRVDERREELLERFPVPSIET